MGPVLIIVAIAVIVAITVLVVVRRRGASAESSKAPAEVPSPPRGELRSSEPARAPSKPRPERARPAAVEGSASAITAELEPPPPKPTLSDSELRAQVKSQLADSERMLGELKQVEAGTASDTSVSDEMVNIIEEGLQEVRSLADRKQWSQARDKGQALRAQLSLMLQSARREQAS